MKGSESGFMIRAGSTTASFAKRLGGHFNCSKLKKGSDRGVSRFYSSYALNEEASEKDIDASIRIPIGRWDDTRSYVGIEWEKKNSKKQLQDLFE